jgi:hypothetical protein
LRPPSPELSVDVAHITLIALDDRDAILVSTSTTNGESVYGLSGDSRLTDWYPSDVPVVAIQFSAALMTDDFGDRLEAREVRVGRTTACRDTCEGFIDNFRVKAGRVCNKFWDGGSTDGFPVQFYERVDGAWTRRVARTATSGVNVDDIRCKLSLEIRPSA